MPVSAAPCVGISWRRLGQLGQEVLPWFVSIALLLTLNVNMYTFQPLPDTHRYEMLVQDCVAGRPWVHAGTDLFGSRWNGETFGIGAVTVALCFVFHCDSLDRRRGLGCCRLRYTLAIGWRIQLNLGHEATRFTSTQIRIHEPLSEFGLVLKRSA